MPPTAGSTDVIQHAAVGARMQLAKVFPGWRMTEERQEHLELIREMKDGLRVAGFT